MHMEVPLEIVRSILRHATAVPSALDTSWEATTTGGDEISRALTESMRCKTALSLVCKEFHDLNDEFLFEFITLREWHHIRPLVNLLRQRRGRMPNRGWWCRRLELDLNSEQKGGNSWSWGRITLWGLLSACPRIVDLRCAVHNKSYPGMVIRTSLGAYPVSKCLFQTIAWTQGSSLERLEFTGHIQVHLDLLKRLLPFLTALKIFRHPIFLPQFLIEENDSKENHIYCPDLHENQEYEAARLGARWPRTRTRGPVHLPHLHTLDVLYLDADMAGWSLPALRIRPKGITAMT